MINFNNMIKMCGCMVLCSTLLLAILATTMGFIDNQATVDSMQLTMKVAFIGAALGTLGLIVLVLYNDCFYSPDGCCASPTLIDNASSLLPPPSQNVEYTNIIIQAEKPTKDIMHDTQKKKRFLCC